MPLVVFGKASAMVSGVASILSQRQVRPMWFVAAVKLSQMSAGLPAFPSVLTLVGVWTREPVQNKHGSALKGPLSVLQTCFQLCWSRMMSTKGLPFPHLSHLCHPTLFPSVYPPVFSFICKEKNASSYRVKTFSS